MLALDPILSESITIDRNMRWRAIHLHGHTKGHRSDGGQRCKDATVQPPRDAPASHKSQVTSPAESDSIDSRLERLNEK